MQRVKKVLDENAGEIAAHLALRADFGPDLARRFVELAGAELVASWEWQADSLQLEDLATWNNVQRLLGGIHAKALASDLELPAEVVWHALRAFVPRVLLLATRSAQPVAGRGAARSRGRRPRVEADRSATRSMTVVVEGWPIAGPAPAVSPG